MRFTAFATAIILAGCAGPRPASQPVLPAATAPISDRADLEAELKRAAAGDIERVWARILAAKRMPLVFGQTAMFFYRGPGERVEFRGEFTEWWPSWDVAAERIGTTDIWRKTVQLLPASRLDYKLVVDGKWSLDPNNPFQQIGGYGPNSEARMPGWSPSPYVERRPSTPRGTFTENLSIASEKLGYSINYRVYTPPGLDTEAKDLPTLFVTDGSDYYRDEMGAMVIILDRLYEERLIRPIVVVFIDPWNDERSKNRREQELVPKSMTDCAYCDFIVERLIPEVARRFPTTSNPADRGILGTSWGGVHATYMGLRYAQHFGLIGMQSPAYHADPARFVWRALMEAKSFPSKAFLNFGMYERAYIHRCTLAGKHLQEIGVDLAYHPAPEGHSFGHWRAYLDEALIHFFGNAP